VQHARDELGIDIDELANPLQASLASAVAFAAGAAVPLLAGAFLGDPVTRNIVVAVASVVGLIILGATGAALGGAKKILGAVRVLIGGSLAMGITYAIGLGFARLAPDGKITPA
jgi:VIT1/CCC1 family predicted Fe2+/Mn2+ transporter